MAKDATSSRDFATIDAFSSEPERGAKESTQHTQDNASAESSLNAKAHYANYSPQREWNAVNSTNMSINDRKKRIVSRVLYVAKTVNKETSKQHLSGFHTDNFQRMVGKADKITGFLLIYPTCCLHVIEADTSSLMAVLRSLSSDASAIESMCILSFTEDVTYRFFPSWMAGFINAANLGPYEPKNTPKSIISEISSLNINVLRWGKKLSEMDKTQQAQALDSVRSSTEEFLPDDPATIFAFILADETPKLQEFLEIYDLPPKDIVFNNDLVWPMPKEPFKWT